MAPNNENTYVIHNLYITLGKYVFKILSKSFVSKILVFDAQHL